MVEGALIRVRHQCRKYDHDDSVTGNFFGVVVTRDDEIQKIDAEYKMKVWENLKFANDTTILDKDWVRATFSEGCDLWGHHVKKPSVDLAPEVTVAITIRKWNIFATVDYFERANGKKIEKENAEKVI